MENPNNSSRIRRCNSLPSKLQRQAALLPKRLRRMQTNPYIGSFRHAPPTSLRSMQASLTEHHAQHFYFSSSPPQSTMKNSPYIGWFRHAPPSKVRLHKVNSHEMALLDKSQALAMILKNGSRPERARPHLANYITGRLCGGGRDEEECYDVTHGPHKANSFHVSIASSNILAKLGTWFLFPGTFESEYKECFANDGGLKLLSDHVECADDSDSDSALDDENSDCDDDDDDDDSLSNLSLSDFDAPATSSRIPSASTSEPLDISVSEIAEAYYAHQVMDQGEYSLLGGDRLDYVITQVDIARMARNAARHLDVDSILNLPTVTYRSPQRLRKQDNRSAKDSRDPEEAFSFIMVPQDTIKSSGQAGAEPDTVDTVCVICLEQFAHGDRLRVLPCDHSFHVGCIDRWLSGSHSHNECFTSGCPTCKKRPAATSVTTPVSSTPAFDNTGSVPSWAFAQLGSQMAQSMNE